VLLIVIPLALLAALLYAVSDFLEQRAARRAARGGTSSGGDPSEGTLRKGLRAAHATAHRMVRDRQWFAGWMVGTLGYLVQGAALHLGSVGVVQSLQVTTLLFTLPLSTVGRPERPHWRDWLGGASACVGLGLFLIVRGSAPEGPLHRGRVLFLLFLLAATVAVLATSALLRHGPIRATLLACAAGVAFASSATLVKLTSDDLTNVGIPGTATDWPGYALAVATGTGVVLQQAAFASGRLPTATTAMVVTNPLVGSVVAVVGFGERFPHSLGGLSALAVAGFLIAAGVATLSHSPLLRSDESSEPAAAPQPGRTA
jgi:drug/metabolite transporter (DMT)-like permease